MKIKNLILLACVLNMPMQSALSETAKGFVPASATKSNVARPGKVPTVSNGRSVKGPVSIAGPGSSPSSGALQKPAVAGGVNAVVNPMLKPNLIISSIGLNNETCAEICPQVLRDLRINMPCSPVSVVIKNIGRADITEEFSIKLSYTNTQGMTINKTQVVNGLGAGRVGVAVFDDNAIQNNVVAWYKIDRPFIAVVDTYNRVNESNEADNTKQIYLR